MRRLALLCLLLVLILSAVPAQAAGPWKGRVIDVETKEPLEGAVVLAVWERVYRTPAGNNSYFYEAMETLTDKDGRFEIPSYITINVLPLISFMRGPEFTIFKPGYGSFPDHRISPPILGVDPAKFFSTAEVGTEGVMVWEGIGKRTKVTFGVVELPRLKTREERLRLLPSGLMYKKSEKKAGNYIRLLNLARQELGLKPTGEVSK